MFDRFMIGSINYLNGDKYQGQIHDYEPHGWGKLEIPEDKNFYRGLFTNGVKNGFGKKICGDRMHFFDYEHGKEKFPARKGKQPEWFWNNLNTKT